MFGKHTSYVVIDLEAVFDRNPTPCTAKKLDALQQYLVATVSKAATYLAQFAASAVVRCRGKFGLGFATINTFLLSLKFRITSFVMALEACTHTCTFNYYTSDVRMGKNATFSYDLHLTFVSLFR